MKVYIVTNLDYKEIEKVFDSEIKAREYIESSVYVYRDYESLKFKRNYTLFGCYIYEEKEVE